MGTICFKVGAKAKFMMEMWGPHGTYSVYIHVLACCGVFMWHFFFYKTNTVSHL